MEIYPSQQVQLAKKCTHGDLLKVSFFNEEAVAIVAQNADGAKELILLNGSPFGEAFSLLPVSDDLEVRNFGSNWRLLPDENASVKFNEGLNKSGTVFVTAAGIYLSGRETQGFRDVKYCRLDDVGIFGFSAFPGRKGSAFTSWKIEIIDQELKVSETFFSHCGE
ncbi:hypothetical protein [Pseudophaeobacter sp.]|uniref:hypothetical protein n=1 Tax=Pseudophaeobacter sp. TaxID=1971739 RepID=UPI00329A78E7